MLFTAVEKRKQIEVRLHFHFLGATKSQVAAIRRLAPDIAEGKLSWDDAVAQIEATHE